MGVTARIRRRGIVLPTVLVMLVVMTTVVLFLIRRGSIDERLAGNMRGVTSMESAAQYALRWCELRVWETPPGIQPPVGKTALPYLDPTVDNTQYAAWNDPTTDWWATSKAVTLPAIELVSTGNSNISTTAQCLIEDATRELQINLQTRDRNRLPSDLLWKKYRITVEVRQPLADIGIDRLAHAQSEIRMFIQ